MRIPHYMASGEFTRFIRALPKTETHLHLEGSTPIELLKELEPAKFAEAPPFWSPEYRYRDFDQFMKLYDEYCLTFYTTAQRYHDAAKIVLATCREQGCRYVETSIHLPGLAFVQDSGPEVLAAIREAAPAGMEVRIFAGMCHNDYARHGALIESALGWDDLAGVDLHGPEYWPMESWTAGVWERARAAGKATKAHAGEFMPASYVRWVLDNLGVRRVEHGVRSVEDPELVQRLVRDDITLDVCPISNVKLAVQGVPEMKAHPIRRLFDAGVRVTINSDDTFFFGNRLEEEYIALNQELGFTRWELARMARNGFEIALVDEAVRARLLAEWDGFVEAQGLKP
jgi:adenosine deaminase